MKKLLLIPIFTIICFAVFSQQQIFSIYDSTPVDSITQKVTFSKTIEIPNSTKDEIYYSIKQWVVTQNETYCQFLMDNTDYGIIVLKNCFSGDNDVENMYFTTEINIKDNKCRIIVSNIYFETIPDMYNSNVEKYFAEEMITDKYFFKKNGKPNRILKTYKIRTIEQTNYIIDCLENSIKKNLAENW